VFTELGYTSRDYTAREPWLICAPPGTAPPTGDLAFAERARRSHIVLGSNGQCSPNADLQGRCYEAALRVWANASGMQGMFWWSWLPYADAGGECSTDFTPQNKPAEAVLARWYEAPRARSDALVVQARPQPFVREVDLICTLRAPSAIALEVYDMRGRRIRTLTHGVTSGRQTLRWDGTDDAGAPVPAGVYCYRLTAGTVKAAGRLVRLE
jgi:hypothetical protein